MSDKVQALISELEIQKYALDVAAIVSIFDAQGKLLYVNGNYSEISGYVAQEILGKSFSYPSKESHDERFFATIWNILDTGQPWRGQVQSRSKSGDSYWVQRTIVPYEEHHKKLYLCLSFDITAQKKQEAFLAQAYEELSQAEQKNRSNLEKLLATNEEIKYSKMALQAQKYALDKAALVSLTDLEGNLTYVNDKFAHRYGYTQAELIGNTHSLLNPDYHNPDVAFFAKIWARVAEGEVWKGKIKSKTKDGEPCWTQTTAVPLPDANGNPVNYLFIGFDITKQELQYRELKETHQILEATEEEMRQNMEEVNTVTELLLKNKNELEGQKYALDQAAFVLQIDTSQNVSYVNDKLVLSTGYEKSEILGLSCEQIHQKLINPKDLETIWIDFLAGNVSRKEVSFMTKDSQELWVDVTAVPQYNDFPNAEPSHLLLIAFDITEKKRHQARIKEEEALKDALLSTNAQIIILIDVGGKIIQANPSAVEYWQKIYNQKLQTGAYFSESVPTKNERRFFENLILRAYREKNYEVEQRFIALDGRAIWLNMQVQAVYLDDRSLIGIAIRAHDVSQAREREKILNKQHSDIKASINYAQRIQKSALPVLKSLQEDLPESFIYFEPKDVVSGDFYWFAKQDKHFFLVAADCTGHGVPGAFMSLIGINLLDQIIKIKKEYSPAHILKDLDEGIVDALQQKETGNRDGMDISICRIDYKDDDLKEPINICFAGAKNPLVYFKGYEKYKIKANRVSLGGYHKRRKKNFEQECLKLEKGEKYSFYIFSDGYRDQFGGENNQKLMSANFYKLLRDIQDFPMPMQNKTLAAFFERWKGQESQIDDVVVVGFSLRS
ncbi:MAG: PAS domain S-box protein [Bernardetiaceae bacterium]|nr:PAS domain S-box protein [Bernardetiaceae bacterium]